MRHGRDVISVGVLDFFQVAFCPDNSIGSVRGKYFDGLTIFLPSSCVLSVPVFIYFFPFFFFSLPGACLYVDFECLCIQAFSIACMDLASSIGNCIDL